ncbi:hypothetical protein H5P36_02265 [Bacillus sp. APMAM]|nr:hypothetical protein [Bacillus sp. APMAM]
MKKVLNERITNRAIFTHNLVKKDDNLANLPVNLAIWDYLPTMSTSTTFDCRNRYEKKRP